MKGRQRGRPTKRVLATVQELLEVGKPGVTFEVWDKWKRKHRKVGTLTVSVGGLRWWPRDSPNYRQRNWEQLAEWFERN
jgi:hypothetical protein